MTKAQLHQLVDRLPEGSLDAAAILLERAQDPSLAKLIAAPYDDEPETPDERAVLAEAIADPSPSIPWDRAEQEVLTD